MQQSNKSEELGSEIAANLEQADQHMQAAIIAFGRAKKMRLSDLIRTDWSSQRGVSNEEAHVEYALTSVLTANEKVTSAAMKVGYIVTGNPSYKPLRNNVIALQEHFQSLIDDMRQQPNARQVITDLKRVRRIIPRTNFDTSSKI